MSMCLILLILRSFPISNDLPLATGFSLQHYPSFSASCLGFFLAALNPPLATSFPFQNHLPLVLLDHRLNHLSGQRDAPFLGEHSVFIQTVFSNDGIIDQVVGTQSAYHQPRFNLHCTICLPLANKYV